MSCGWVHVVPDEEGGGRSVTPHGRVKVEETRTNICEAGEGGSVGTFFGGGVGDEIWLDVVASEGPEMDFLGNRGDPEAPDSAEVGVRNRRAPTTRTDMADETLLSPGPLGLQQEPWQPHRLRRLQRQLKRRDWNHSKPRR